MLADDATAAPVIDPYSTAVLQMDRSHVDTVLADAADWRHDPWSGEIHDGFLWGRGALDMKSQTAAEAVAAARLARDGGRPTRGALKVFPVVDEENKLVGVITVDDVIGLLRDR